MWGAKIILKFISILMITNFIYVESKRARIVGGRQTQISEFPYLGVYLSRKEFVCSCILITSSFAITAAHCTYFHPWSISVRFGSTFRDRNGIIVDVLKFIQNPDFSIETFDYDISVLKLSKQIRFTARIQPIKLPENENDMLNVGTSVRVAGWGLKSYEDLAAPVHLMSTTVQIVDFDECSRNYQRVAQTLTNRMFCASGLNTDTCLGDSGGPLVFNHTLHGIVSFGYGCSYKDYPGVYANVSYLLSFIKLAFEQLS